MENPSLDFKVDLARLNDKEEILKLLDEVFLSQQTVQNITRGTTFWNWKYLNCKNGRW